MLNWWVLQTAGLEGKSRSSPAVSHCLLPTGCPHWPCKDNTTFLSIFYPFSIQGASVVCSHSDYETLHGPMCWAIGGPCVFSCVFDATSLPHKPRSQHSGRKMHHFPSLFVFCSWILWSYYLLHFLSLWFPWDPWNTWGKCYILLFWPVFCLSFPVLDLILQPALGDYVVLCWTYQEI